MLGCVDIAARDIFAVIAGFLTGAEISSIFSRNFRRCRYIVKIH
jgi:hypothetical protein